VAGKSEAGFDVIIVGSGPGGYVGAIRASQLGLRVACVETEALGGVCLNIGCIPTKALLTSALLVNEMREGEQHGIVAKDLTFDLAPAQQRSRRVADQMRKGVGHLFKKNGITHIEGFGRLKGAGKVEVEGSDGNKTVHEAKHVILATGSRPRDLPTLKIDEDRIWSSTGALMHEKAPESLFIVGAGAIGMEFADVYASFGTQVTFVEALDRILPLEDAEVSKFMERAYS
jgi:dihydrolipoamide dehydrogenase